MSSQQFLDIENILFTVTTFSYLASMVLYFVFLR